MIIYSITYALGSSYELDWLAFMKVDQIAIMMDSGYFEDFTFTRVLPQEGVDTAYNVQYHCFNYEKLELFISNAQADIDAVLLQKYSGKIAMFHTKLEVLL